MPLDEQLRHWTQLVIGNQQYEFNRLFYGISKRPTAFSVFMNKNFWPLVLSKNVLTYLDYVLMQSQTKHVLENITKRYLRKTWKQPQLNHISFLLFRHIIEGSTTIPLKFRTEAIIKL